MLQGIGLKYCLYHKFLTYNLYGISHCSIFFLLFSVFFILFFPVFRFIFYPFLLPLQTSGNFLSLSFVSTLYLLFTVYLFSICTSFSPLVSDPATSPQSVGIHTTITCVPSPTVVSTSVTSIRYSWAGFCNQLQFSVRTSLRQMCTCFLS